MLRSEPASLLPSIHRFGIGPACKGIEIRKFSCQNETPPIHRSNKTKAGSAGYFAIDLLHWILFFPLRCASVAREEGSGAQNRPSLRWFSGPCTRDGCNAEVIDRGLKADENQVTDIKLLSLQARTPGQFLKCAHLQTAHSTLALSKLPGDFLCTESINKF